MKKIVCILAFFLVSTANASIIYDIDRTIGAGSVVGSITTDGTLGSLGTSNFIDWDLTLNDGSGSFTIYGPSNISSNSALSLSGNFFSATLNDLLFDFSGSGYALFQNPSPGSGINWWCVEGINVACAGSGSSTESVRVLTSLEFVQHSGEVIISSTNTNTVPEPGILALFGLGLAGLGFSRKKKKAS